MSGQAESVAMQASRPAGRISAPLAAVEGALVWAGDRLNPILVKEARQALKSRQFVLTFGLLLICGWVWSILGLAILGPEAAYGFKGPAMFAGYYVILAFPLMVIVPFGAFRSLASEQEDRTYELLSITALNPRQIVSGKLGSAALQMLIYLSAISPCLAFTYMLRGISFPSILFVVGYLFLTSLAFSVVGLLVGTLSTEKHWQVVLSVLLIVGLFAWFWISLMMMFGEVWFEIPFGEKEFWQGLAGFMTGYVTYFALVFCAAVASISFPSENRSTPLRIIMLVQYVCFAGWMAWVLVAVEPEVEILMVFMLFAGLHWYAMGALMTGESPVLSMRVRRRLPQSFLGRVFLTWFNPGSGTGYMFAVCGGLGALAMVLVAVVSWGASPQPSSDEVSCAICFSMVGVSYLVIYLGLGLLVIRLLRRLGHVRLFSALLVHALLVLIGTAVPVVIQLTSPTLRLGGYSLVQIPNPFWTLVHIGGRSTLPVEAPVLLTVLPLAAIVVFLLNLPGVAEEVRYVRIAKPRRVAEEDALLAARLAPPQPSRTSPWDE